MRLAPILIAIAAGLALCSGPLAWAGPAAPAAGQPLVITADQVHQVKGVTTWTGHVTLSGAVDPARTALTLDGKPSAIVDLATLPPIASAKLTNKGKGAKRAKLDLTSKR